MITDLEPQAQPEEPAKTSKSRQYVVLEVVYTSENDSPSHYEEVAFVDARNVSHAKQLGYEAAGYTNVKVELIAIPASQWKSNIVGPDEDHKPRLKVS